MNCTGAEKLIYLEAELDQREKWELHHHLENCAKCESLYRSVIHMQVHISELGETKETALDSVRLTNKVMSRIYTKKKTSWNLPRRGFLLRLGLSGISILLVTGFFFEVNQSPQFKRNDIQNGSIVTHSGGTHVLRQTEERKSLMAVAEARLNLKK